MVAMERGGELHGMLYLKGINGGDDEGGWLGFRLSQYRDNKRGKETISVISWCAVTHKAVIDKNKCFASDLPFIS